MINKVDTNQFSTETYRDLLDSVKRLREMRNELDKNEFNKYASHMISIADKYGIKNEIKAALGVNNKNKNDYALQKEASTKDTANYLPLRNPKEIKAATTWLINYRDRLNYSERRQAASKILKQASDQNAYIPDEDLNLLYRIAGLGVGQMDRIKGAVIKRADLIKRRGQEKLAKVLEGMVEALEDVRFEDFYKNKMDVKVAEELDICDKVTGMVHQYGRLLNPPEDDIYAITRRDIEQFDDNIIKNTKTGSYYLKQDICRLDQEILKNTLGKEILRSIKIGHVLNTEALQYWLDDTSKRTAELFDEIARISGVTPYIQKVPK